MSTPFQMLHHLCVVVHDLDRSVGFYESVGVGPWQDFAPLTDFTRLEVPNKDAFLQMEYKFVNLANVQLQLCEPRRSTAHSGAFSTATTRAHSTLASNATSHRRRRRLRRWDSTSS